VTLSGGWRALLGNLFVSSTTASLKKLERQAFAHPHDAMLQYRFLAELAGPFPEAVVQRFQQSSFALALPTVLLYLSCLQRTHQHHLLEVDDLLQRLSRSEPAVASQLTQIKQHLAAAKNKSELVQQLQQVLLAISSGGTSNGTSSTAPGMNPLASAQFPVTAAMGATATNQSGLGSSLWNSLGLSSSSNAAALAQPRGMDSRYPLHVQIVSAGSSPRQLILTFLARATLLVIAFSAVGALLDERGLGRGLGGMSNSQKHLQEADATGSNGRKVKFDDVKGCAEAKAELEEIVLYLKDPSKFTRLGGRLPRGLVSFILEMDWFSNCCHSLTRLVIYVNF
jgi:hypothetical protein